MEHDIQCLPVMDHLKMRTMYRGRIDRRVVQYQGQKVYDCFKFSVLRTRLCLAEPARSIFAANRMLAVE